MKKKKSPSGSKPIELVIRIATDDDLVWLDAKPDPIFMARIKADEIREALTPRSRPVGYVPIDVDPSLLR